MEVVGDHIRERSKHLDRHSIRDLGFRHSRVEWERLFRASIGVADGSVGLVVVGWERGRPLLMIGLAQQWVLAALGLAEVERDAPSLETEGPLAEAEEAPEVVVVAEDRGTVAGLAFDWDQWRQLCR
jgi:hypothetical protein